MKHLLFLVLSLSAGLVHGQDQPPKGFKKGTLVLTDSSRQDGFIKESLSSHAAVQYMKNPGSPKKEYTGQQLISAQIEETKYMCIRGDFFRVIEDGELQWLQKSSDASAIPSYNGTEAIFISGTEGKPGDYFVYDTKNRQLRLVTRKNFREVAGTVFRDYSPSLAVATSPEAEITRLKTAVALYNIRLAK